jgi:hypothetical protein
MNLIEDLKQAVTFLRDSFEPSRDYAVYQTAHQIANCLDEIIARPNSSQLGPILQVLQMDTYQEEYRRHAPTQILESEVCAKEIVYSVISSFGDPLFRIIQATPEQIVSGRSPSLIGIRLRPSQITL